MSPSLPPERGRTCYAMSLRYRDGNIRTKEVTMALFKSKPKQSIEQCNKYYYDSQIFHSSVAGRDAWVDFLKTAYNSITEVDPSFSSIVPRVFLEEMTALRMELFGLAWSQRFKKEKQTYPQSIFTRDYLVAANRQEVWDVMREYNQSVAMSATANANGSQFSGTVGGVVVTHVNTMKTQIWEDWAKSNISGEALTDDEKAKAQCVTRVINRFGADIKREKGVVVRLLTSRLADRLGCDANLKTEALFRLSALTFGFYKGAEEYLQTFDLLV